MFSQLFFTISCLDSLGIWQPQHSAAALAAASENNFRQRYLLIYKQSTVDHHVHRVEDPRRPD